MIYCLDQIVRAGLPQLWSDMALALERIGIDRQVNLAPVVFGSLGRWRPRQEPTRRRHHRGRRRTPPEASAPDPARQVEGFVPSSAHPRSSGRRPTNWWRPSRPADRLRFPEVFRQSGRINDGEWYRHAWPSCCFVSRRDSTRSFGQQAYARPQELMADLDMIDRSLRAHDGSLMADGRLARVRSILATIGFTLAALDIREHAKRHHASLGELFRSTGITYPDDRGARTALLLSELTSRRPPAHPIACRRR
ncbi:MAG: phosphoenolpyruvate carboxylase [Acidimicrobiales bacterium]